MKFLPAALTLLLGFHALGCSLLLDFDEDDLDPDAALSPVDAPAADAADSADALELDDGPAETVAIVEVRSYEGRSTNEYRLDFSALPG